MFKTQHIAKGMFLGVSKDIGERVLDLSDIVEENKHGFILKFHTNSAVQLVKPMFHDIDCIWATHAVDAVAIENGYYELGRALKSFALTTACRHYGLISLNVPQFANVLLLQPGYIAVADYYQTGTYHFILNLKDPIVLDVLKYAHSLSEDITKTNHETDVRFFVRFFGYPGREHKFKNVHFTDLRWLISDFPDNYIILGDNAAYIFHKTEAGLEEKWLRVVAKSGVAAVNAVRNTYIEVS